MSGSPTLDQAGIERLLLERLARLRRRDARTLDATTPFNEFVVDSIEAAGIAVELESEFGLGLDPVDLVDHPTPRALARHLAVLSGKGTPP